MCFDRPIVTFKQLIFCWRSKIHCFFELSKVPALCLKQAIKKGVISALLYQPWNETITVTLNRTALWLTNCWTTQGGIRSLSPSSLNITAIWNEVTFNQSKKVTFCIYLYINAIEQTEIVLYVGITRSTKSTTIQTKDGKGKIVHGKPWKVLSVLRFNEKCFLICFLFSLFLQYKSHNTSWHDSDPCPMTVLQTGKDKTNYSHGTWLPWRHPLDLDTQS